MWRPKGFKNPYPTNGVIHDAWENGADALLEALRTSDLPHYEVAEYFISDLFRAMEIPGTKHIEYKGIKGRLVFIPDDNVGDKI